jgi:hypothetical protein
VSMQLPTLIGLCLISYQLLEVAHMDKYTK